MLKNEIIIFGKTYNIIVASIIDKEQDRTAG